MTKAEADEWLQGFKDYFADQKNIQFLHDLQVEGLALNLIYKARPKGLICDHHDFYEKIDTDSIKIDFIPVYHMWSKYPEFADLRIPLDDKF